MFRKMQTMFMGDCSRNIGIHKQKAGQHNQFLPAGTGLNGAKIIPLKALSEAQTCRIRNMTTL